VEPVRWLLDGDDVHALRARRPAFKWISLEAFVLGFVESFLYGVYTGLLFVSIHNFWWPRRETRSSDTSATVRAA